MEEKSTSNLRWLMAVRGALFICFGLIALFYPGLTILGLVWFLGIVAIFNGVLALFEYFLNKNHAHLGVGVIEIIIGILVMLYPDISAAIFIWILTLWLLVAGFSLFFSGASMPKEYGPKAFPVIGGCLMVLLGFFLIVQPIWLKALDILWGIGILSILSGITLLIMSIIYFKKPKK